MQKSDIQLLYAYNTWANRKILAASAGVTSEEFAIPIGYSWGSLQAILVHILTAELVWRTRIQGGDAKYAFLEASDFVTPAALIERWSVETGLLDEFLDSLQEADLQKTIRYTNTRGQAFEQVCWQILAHVVNHGTQHRSEAAQILTSLDRSPGDLDMIMFLRE